MLSDLPTFRRAQLRQRVFAVCCHARRLPLISIFFSHFHIAAFSATPPIAAPPLMPAFRFSSPHIFGLSY
jgi:hypothetical protein